jgi:hypothetical protein
MELSRLVSLLLTVSSSKAPTRLGLVGSDSIVLARVIRRVNICGVGKWDGIVLRLRHCRGPTKLNPEDSRRPATDAAPMPPLLPPWPLVSVRQTRLKGSGELLCLSEGRT